jgi:hypothetical protein
VKMAHVSNNDNNSNSENSSCELVSQVQPLMHGVASTSTCILMFMTLPGLLCTATHQGSEQGVLLYRFGVNTLL